MADLASICVGQRQACALRATRLDVNCAPVLGAGNGAVTAGLVTLNADPEVEEGAKFQPKNACDNILWTAEEEDKIVRYTGDFEMGLWDYELIELLTNSALGVGAVGTPWAGQNVGLFAPGPTTPSAFGCGLEIWVKNAGAGSEGQCGPEGTHPPYTRYVFPLVKIRPGGRTFNGEASMFTGSIKISPNPAWGDGPYGDWQLTTDFSDEPDKAYVQFADEDLPATSCGYVSVGS